MTSTREALVEAAGAALDERPWSKLSMGEVARRAGVSRQTLYNEFGGRTELAEALVVSEAERLLAGPIAAISAGGDPRRAIERALRSFLEAAAHNRLVQAMTEEAEDGLLALVTTRDAVLTAATERLAAVVQDAFPTVGAAEARRLTEVVVRLGISHAALPSAVPARTARDLTAVLGPHLDELLAPSQRSRAA